MFPAPCRIWSLVSLEALPAVSPSISSKIFVSSRWFLVGNCGNEGTISIYLYIYIYIPLKGFCRALTPKKQPVLGTGRTRCWPVGTAWDWCRSGTRLLPQLLLQREAAPSLTVVGSEGVRARYHPFKGIKDGPHSLSFLLRTRGFLVSLELRWPVCSSTDSLSTRPTSLRLGPDYESLPPWGRCGLYSVIF